MTDIKHCICFLCLLCGCLFAPTPVYSSDPEEFKSLTEIIQYHIDDIVESEQNWDQSRNQPFDKILIWGENLPEGIKTDKRVYVIGREMLSGNNAPKGMLRDLRSSEANELYSFDISLNSSVLMVRVVNDYVRFEKRDSADIFESFNIYKRGYDEYIYRLRDGRWQYDEFYEGNGIDNLREESIMSNNELQSLVSKSILKAVETFKQKGFKGIYLALPNYVIASYPWIFNNYSFNPNFLSNMMVSVPTGNDRILCYRDYLSYSADNSFYINLFDDYQTDILFILDPNYSLIGDRLNITIVLSELKKDKSGHISLSSLSKHSVKFDYATIDNMLRWQEVE